MVANYERVFEELMFYGTINVKEIKSLDDIRKQLHSDRHIGFMRNSNRFITAMLNTSTAQFVVRKLVGRKRLTKAIEKTVTVGGFKKKMDRFNIKFVREVEKEGNKVIVDGFVIRDGKLKKVKARMLVRTKNGQKRIAFKDLKTGKFVSRKRFRFKGFRDL